VPAPDIPRLPDESLTDYVRRRAAILGIELPEKPPDIPPPKQEKYFDPDLVPDDPTPDNFKRERMEIDAVLNRLDIVEAYNLYCRKMVCDPKGKTESIMVSCPFPGHEDRHPSAWLTLDKGDGGVGNCPQDGGFDKYDIAAWRYGFDVPGYKDGKNFPELRRRMAEGLGWTLMVAGKESWLERTQPLTQETPKQEAPATEPVATSQSDVAPPIESEDDDAISPYPLHTHFENNEDDEEAGFNYAQLPVILEGEDNFLRAWMTEMSKSTQPNEFYFFLGLLALGLASHNNVILVDETPVRSNLMICLVGGTGTGKSRSIDWFKMLLRQAVPYHYDTSAGVRIISGTGSGEDLIDQLVNITTDPVTKDKTSHPVHAIYLESEMEGYMARINRAGSTMRSVCMNFNDSSDDVIRSSRSGGMAIAKGHYLSTLTTTQPKRLSHLLTTGDASSGFLNRWIFPFGTEKFRPSISDVKIDLTEAADLLAKVRGWASGGKEVSLKLDPEAVKLWDELVQTEIRQMEATDNLLVSRIELISKKILLTFAINSNSTWITASHVRSLMMLFPYLKKCYGIVERNVGVTQLEECTEVIRKYFAFRPNNDITMRTLSKQSGARKFDTFLRIRALENLEKGGEIVQVPRPKNVTAPMWRYNPDQPVALAQVIPIRQ